jgi:hypothetical protein
MLQVGHRLPPAPASAFAVNGLAITTTFLTRDSNAPLKAQKILGYIKEDLLRPSTGKSQSGNGSLNTEKPWE